MSFKTEKMCFHNVLYDQNGKQIEIDVSSRQIDHCKLFISILIQIQLIKLHNHYDWYQIDAKLLFATKFSAHSCSSLLTNIDN